jgi:penicillin amidase
MKLVFRIAGFVGLVCGVAILVYIVNVAIGMRIAARTSGTPRGLGVLQPTVIVRDRRDVPHIFARNEHDLFFAEGFVEGSDRLFQMDVTRRAVEGRLAEIFGARAVAADEYAREVPVEQIAQAQWTRLPARLKRDLQAFADGVNAAVRTQPLPVEFRILLYKPQPWKPQDSLVTSFAIVLELTDTWNDIAQRQEPHLHAYAKLHPLTDPCYDAPVLEGLARISESPRCLSSLHNLTRRATAGSNAWAAGASHTATHRALLANDPHLPPSIPGIWYLVDLRYPGFHVAGATIAGVPGVLLGHSDRLAWGATNGSTASLSVFHPPAHLNPAKWVDETIHVRFGRPVHVRYYRGMQEFGVRLRGGRLVLVRWNAYGDPDSPFATFVSLDRARSIADALRALRAYPGPTQNFVLADTTGRVAYQLAGEIPDDPAWGRYIHPSRDLAKNYPDVPFNALPHVALSRSAIVWTANNKMYGPGYPYRLSPEFSPPYRAYRIAQLLKTRSRFDVAYFATMQMDTLSLPELELARLAGLTSWEGHFDPYSLEATRIFHLRVAVNNNSTQRMTATTLRFRNPHFRKMLPRLARIAERGDPTQGPEPWGIAGALAMKHPLSALHLTFLNGTTLPGDGDAYTIHVQAPDLSQSFRAVWDVGNWDAGGISLPQGESGEPGSGHYTDEAAAWIAGKLLPLPYSKAAVEASARARLILLP